MRRSMPKIRQWDALTGLRVDSFMANSSTTAARIRKIYRRDAQVVHPPVDTDYYTPGDAEPEDYYLVLSRLVPYKRVDLAVQACTALGRPLVVIGEGPERKRLEAMAGPTVTFKGFLPFEECREHYRRCRAFLFPGLEDFGITPVEAMACGRPVIAYGAGGARDSVKPGETGLFFKPQEADSLAAAIEEFEGLSFDPAAVRRRAEGFSAARFRRQVAGHVAAAYGELEAGSSV
jgi:glycosyltransferase involved in cell wall biosynthesis